MNLCDYIAPEDVRLDLRSTTKAEALAELVSGLAVASEDQAAIHKILVYREEMGSTGIGRGVAVPHCRTPLVRRLRVIYGRSGDKIEWDAIDGAPVEHIFVLVAPPVETSNEYLPVLGRIARLGKEADVRSRLAAAGTVEEFRAVLAGVGV